MFDADLFVEMLNGAYKPPAASAVTKAALIAAAATPRIVKKAEAIFKLMPASVVEFDHFGPARWLLENPSALDADTPAVKATLDRFEQVFVGFNKLLDSNVPVMMALRKRGGGNQRVIDLELTGRRRRSRRRHASCARRTR